MRALVCGLAAVGLLVGAARSEADRPPALLLINPVRAENALAGTTAWQVPGGGAELYASEISAAPGDQVHLHVSTEGRYRIVVYRLGWYGGAGARLMACLPSCTADEQGTSQPDPVDAEPVRANWPVTDTLQTGTTWVSGYYLVEALATSGPQQGKAGTTFFVLHPPSGSSSQILVQVPVNTWEAYNWWGKHSLYDVRGGRRATAVSFDRPFGELAQSPMWWEIQAVRFLERGGWDVAYQSDFDTDQDPGSLLHHRVLLDIGHDEYWTTAMRGAWDTAQANGVNMIFLGSNDGYWHIDYKDGGRTIWGYKSMNDPNPDVSQKTAMFKEINRPECELMAVENVSITPLQSQLDYTVTPVAAADPWLSATGLKAGDTLAGVVGREHDQLNPWPDSCIHPGLEVLFHYAGTGGDQTADAVKFVTPSGGEVFASGAQQFSWALDSYRSDGSLFPGAPCAQLGPVPPDARVQQFMTNVLVDMTRSPAVTHLRKARGSRQR